jgi:alkylation response protein AidB-like acyl-CoA dehydrogenase
LPERGGSRFASSRDRSAWNNARKSIRPGVTMNFALSDEQRMLRDAARDFLGDRSSSTVVRTLMETDAGMDRELWLEMADLGWQAMAIPEAYGGAGFTMLELGIILEEMGRALTPTPFLSSVVLGANAILLAGNEAQKRDLLPTIAAGTRRLAAAFVESDGGWDPAATRTTVRRDGAVLLITGEKSFVVDGHTADTLIVSARNEAGAVDLYLVDAAASGVAASRLETMDMTRKQAAVSLQDVRVAPETLLGDPGSGVATIAALYDLGAVALAFEQVGGAERCMEMSVAYAKERYQFGRPIGSFQAVKHKCADMLVAVEGARSAAYYAGWAASVGDDDLPVLAALAKSYCSEAFFDVAAETIQVHGGIGFTWEHDAHLYFKRAKTDQLMFGDPAAWRVKLADRVGL